MTAELSILNKSGVVIAADSAVTIGRNNKVFNSANKLFQLSNNHPVGLMIYSNASWMGIPLEIIVKDYSKKLGESSFPELKDYAKDFIDFIKSEYFKKIDPSESGQIVESRMYQMLEGIVDVAQSELITKIESGEIEEPDGDDKANELLNVEFLETIDSLKTSADEAEVLEEFETYQIADFKEDYKVIIDKILKGFYSIHNIKRKGKTTSILYYLIFKELTAKFHPYEDFSGIVIAGYGDDQIFPALSEIYLGEVISKRLRYEMQKEREVTHNNTAIVVPFAQRDMVDTFFQGVEPDLLDRFKDEIINSYEELVSQINGDFKLDKETAIRKKFQKQYEKLTGKFYEIRDKIHVQPIVQSVSFLPKEDLIELAESLVNITSLKRKTSSDIHSVGGPVDVALISKIDGFQWIKQKE